VKIEVSPVDIKHQFIRKSDYSTSQVGFKENDAATSVDLQLDKKVRLLQESLLIRLWQELMVTNLVGIQPLEGLAAHDILVVFGYLDRELANVFREQGHVHATSCSLARTARRRKPGTTLKRYISSAKAASKNV
jgi:hypothetical protein